MGYLKPFSSQFFASLHLSYLKRSSHMQVEGTDLLMVPQGLVSWRDGTWPVVVPDVLRCKPPFPPPVYQVAPSHTHCPRESPYGTLDRKHPVSRERFLGASCPCGVSNSVIPPCSPGLPFPLSVKSSETGAVLGKAAVGILGACLSFSCWSHGKSAGCSLPGLLPAEYGLRSVR